ncbi:hypothetical protein A2867_05355 [Candidatus Daviesbacteria bacterium RIFCSPHIGHO2_01_FULL_40_11]|uniref:Uncharacterized protein n=1 Tax=Candidatus Daviesbacteria bacterium RIFCSPHIGHO2_01_FULL_40_11 TaxID=1797762 RepID=A0A1F5JL56_9BACT|nr:MAG: hypothetical protein A2867_05355 [Candidatus Daviesbacteria bacterium RIFCSPHIGHO2_01_FULL_40_11]OGE63143.1 MAG: hypothetical protein A2964_00880 [Candidatus Daviesbacteria bacterium RIFCSPLOWO2_01_FULL_40_27]
MLRSKISAIVSSAANIAYKVNAKTFVTKFTKDYDVFWKLIINTINKNRIAAKGDKVVIVSLMGQNSLS